MREAFLVNKSDLLPFLQDSILPYDILGSNAIIASANDIDRATNKLTKKHTLSTFIGISGYKERAPLYLSKRPDLFSLLVKGHRIERYIPTSVFSISDTSPRLAPRGTVRTHSIFIKENHDFCTWCFRIRPTSTVPSRKVLGQQASILCDACRSESRTADSMCNNISNGILTSVANNFAWSICAWLQGDDWRTEYNLPVPTWQGELMGVTDFEHYAIHYLFGGPCAYCNRQHDWWGNQTGMKVRIGFDHMLPSSLGGHNVSHNLVPCCFECNTNKGVLDVERYVNKIKKSGKISQDRIDLLLQRFNAYMIFHRSVDSEFVRHTSTAAFETVSRSKVSVATLKQSLAYLKDNFNVRTVDDLAGGATLDR